MTLLNVLITITAGIAPMIVYAIIVWWFDRYEKEPWPLLIGMFVWGAVPSILLALVAELVLDIPLHSLAGPGLTYNLLGSALIAPVVEESIKGLAVLAALVLFYRQFDDVLDGIVYGSIVGFGFAAVENVLYFLSTLNKSGAGAMFAVIFMRAFLFGLNHALFTSLTGIGLAVARMSRSWPVRLAAPVMGLALAVAAHAVHNAGATLASVTWLGLLLSVASDGTGVVIILAIILLATLQERGWIVQYLADEVTSGLITPGQYHVACSYLERVGQRTDALLKGDLGRFFRLGRFYQMMTLLAFRKYQLASFGDEGGNRESGNREGGNRAEVDRWRRQVAAMQPRL